MGELRTLVLGVAGGVLGAFLKFWIQDLRDWQESRLSKGESVLLRALAISNGFARFRWNQSGPPTLDWGLKAGHLLEDKGEVNSLERKGLVVRNGPFFGEYSVNLTPLGWNRVRELPPYRMP